MTAVDILNLALLKIGVSKSVTTITDQTREAFTGGAIYDHLLRATLRQFPWSFATKYADLTLVEGPAWDGATVQAWDSTATYAIGDVVTNSDVVYYAIAASTNQAPPNATYWSTTPTTQANGDWIYAYRWPDDCLFARRIVNPLGGHGPSAGVFIGSAVRVSRGAGGGRTFDRNPIPFRIGRDVNGLLVYTNQQDADLEYTVIDCDHLWADDLFVDAFTWRLAAYLAPSLSRIADMQKTCMAMYALSFDLANTVSSREQQQEPTGNAEWIDGR